MARTKHDQADRLGGGDREFMTTLAKGLIVLRAFSGERSTIDDTA